MTEIEQLRADLATIQEAARIAKSLGYNYRAGYYDVVDSVLKDKIADLEAQQTPTDEWAEIKRFIDQSPDVGNNPAVKRYFRHLEAKVDELKDELQSKETKWLLENQPAIYASQHKREKLAELTMILNSIPPACGLARELVEKRIESVKREMQG